MATNNTLIAYASRHGNVEKCARELFERLDGNVDICVLNDRESYPDLSAYDSVVIGGSIYHGMIQESVSRFCYDHLDILENKRLGLFICCLYSGERAQKELRESFPAELFRRAHTSDYFGGRVDLSNLSLLEKMVMNRIIATQTVVESISQDKIERFAKKMNTADASEK